MAKEPEPPQPDEAPGAPDDIDDLTPQPQGGPQPPPLEPFSADIYGHED